MQVGELFVTLGVKGHEKTLGTLQSTKKGMENIASTSLEAKAALVGAFYALERLFAASGRAGTDLSNFNATMGVSAQTLQQYQYAARQVGLSNQEVEGSFKALQSTMTKTLMGEGAPKGLARVAQLTGNMTAQDIKRFAEQPQLLIQKLQEYAQKETNAGLRNEVLKSFGVSDGMIAALTRKAFRPEVLSKAPTYSDGEVKSLDRVNAKWANLGDKIEKSIGHFNAKHGDELVDGIGKVTDKVLKLVDAFATLAEKLKVFEGIGKVFEGWGIIMNGLSTGVDALNGAMNDPKKAESLKDSFLGFVSELPSVMEAMVDEAIGDPRLGAPSAAGVKGKPVPVQVVPGPQGQRGAAGAAGAPGQKGPDGAPARIPGHARGLDAVPPGYPHDDYVAGLSSGEGVLTEGINSKLGRFLAKQEAASRGQVVLPRQQPGAVQLRLVVPPSPIMQEPAKAAAPRPPVVTTGGGTSQAITVSQSLHFSHDGKDAKQVSDTHKKAVQSAYRQIAAQGQGS